MFYMLGYWVVLLFLLTGCGGLQDAVRTPLIGFGDIQAEYRFDSPSTNWNTFRLPDSTAFFVVSGGSFNAGVAADRGYVWSLNPNVAGNTSIKARLWQTHGIRGNGFGVMCRADEAGNGYYFVVSSAGQFAILKAVPEMADPIQLVQWQRSGAVRLDTGVNAIEAICLDDYLGFTVNGVFIAEVRDTRFTEGHIGVVVGAVQEAVHVSFDDIIIRDVRVIGG